MSLLATRSGFTTYTQFNPNLRNFIQTAIRAILLMLLQIY